MAPPDALARSIFIPAPGSALERQVAPGSAVVGLPLSEASPRGEDGAWVVVDLEGNLNGAVNLRRFRERVLNAWSRQATGYPTAGRLAAPASELIEIGRTNARGAIDWLDLPAAALWSGESEQSLAEPEPEARFGRPRPLPPRSF